MVKICKFFERLTADGQTLLVVEFLIFCLNKRENFITKTREKSTRKIGKKRIRIKDCKSKEKKGKKKRNCGERHDIILYI